MNTLNIAPFIVVPLIIVGVIFFFWGIIPEKGDCIDEQILMEIEEVMVSGGIFGGHIEFIKRWDGGKIESRRYTESIGYKKCFKYEYK